MNAIVGIKSICVTSVPYIFQKKVLKLWLKVGNNGMEEAAKNRT